jgi:hypothetical protein
VAVCRGDRRDAGHGFFHRDMMAVKQQHTYSIGIYWDDMSGFFHEIPPWKAK